MRCNKVRSKHICSQMHAARPWRQPVPVNSDCCPAWPQSLACAPLQRPGEPNPSGVPHASDREQGAAAHREGSQPVRSLTAGRSTRGLPSAAPLRLAPGTAAAAAATGRLRASLRSPWPHGTRHLSRTAAAVWPRGPLVAGQAAGIGVHVAQCDGSRSGPSPHRCCMVLHSGSTPLRAGLLTASTGSALDWGAAGAPMAARFRASAEHSSSRPSVLMYEQMLCSCGNLGSRPLCRHLETWPAHHRVSMQVPRTWETGACPV